MKTENIQNKRTSKKKVMKIKKRKKSHAKKEKTPK